MLASLWAIDWTTSRCVHACVCVFNCACMHIDVCAHTDHLPRPAPLFLSHQRPLLLGQFPAEIIIELHILKMLMNIIHALD